MNKKLFLTSMVAMGFVAPAMAEPTNTGTFPAGGLMQEDYTYTNAATSTNMAGVYEGSVTAEAQYTDNLYTLVAGQYLPANSETPITCNQNGYFCPGDSNGVYYSSSAQGLTQCPTGYGNSDTGASMNTQCFRSCSGNVTIAHATGVTGNDYYGNGTDTCEPTGCVNGWHLSNGDFAGLNLNKSINYTVSYAKTNGQSDACFDDLNSGEDCSEKPEYAELGVNEFMHVYSYGKIYGVASCSSSTLNDVFSVFLNEGNRFQNGQITQEEFVASLLAVGTPEQDEIIMELISDYSSGEITEQELTQTFLEEFGIGTADNINTDSPGVNCWCKFNGYKPNGGTRQNISSKWVRIPAYPSYESCMNRCVIDCAMDFGSSIGTVKYYDAMFDSFGETLSVCEANRITINWTGTSATEINANNAGTATYGSDIRTPRSATPIPGKTFTGWRFVAPEQTSVQEP